MPDEKIPLAASYVATIVTAAVVLFKLHLTDDQQAEIVAGLTAVLGLGTLIYGAVQAHAKATLAAAKLMWQASTPTLLGETLSAPIDQVRPLPPVDRGDAGSAVR